MRSRLVLLALCAALLASAHPARSDTITLKPRVVALGEWIDGMVSDGKSLWVVETGQRSLAQLNASLTLARRVKLGGIPDKIDVGRDGALYLLLQVEDDVKLWRQSPGNPRGKAIATLPDKSCASQLAAGGGAFVWVLGGCNGDNNAALLRFDSTTGASAKVPLGEGSGGSLMVRQAQVWVGFDKLSVIDEATLAVRASDIDGKLGPQAYFSAFAADAALVYAGIGSDTTKLVVWSPNVQPVTKRPVMVWFHGGAFSYGTANAPRLQGSRLAKRGDVVVVTVNQRLNIFGFLDLSTIGGSEFAQSGNANREIRRNRLRRRPSRARSQRN